MSPGLGSKAQQVKASTGLSLVIKVATTTPGITSPLKAERNGKGSASHICCFNRESSSFLKNHPVDFHWGVLPFLQLQRSLGKSILSYMLKYLVPMAKTGKITWRYWFSQPSVLKNLLIVTHIPQDKGSNQKFNLLKSQSSASQAPFRIWIPCGSC